MSIRELAERDLNFTLSGVDFGMEFQVYNSLTDQWLSNDVNGNPLKAQYNRIATIKNPQTNLRTIVNRSALTVQNSLFPLELKDGILVKVLDINGQLVEGVLKNIASDFSLGFTTWQIESLPNPNISLIPARRGMKNAVS